MLFCIYRLPDSEIYPDTEKYPDFSHTILGLFVLSVLQLFHPNRAGI